MIDLRKAAEMALEAFENDIEDPRCVDVIDKASKALRQALAQPEQKPAGQIMYSNKKLYTVTVFEHAQESDIPVIPFYTAPPKREWVGLTEEEFSELLYFDGRLDAMEVPLIADLVRAVQAKLKEKNDG